MSERSKPPVRWSPSGCECEWYSAIAWTSCGISRLISADLVLGDVQPARRLAQVLLLLGVGLGVAALLADLLAVQVGPRLHQILRPPLDLRLPVAELVALQEVAHPPEVHVNAAQRVRASSAKAIIAFLKSLSVWTDWTLADRLIFF